MKLSIAVRHRHISGMADAGKAVIFFHQRHDFLARNGAKEGVESVLDIRLATCFQGIFIPRQVHHHG